MMSYITESNVKKLILSLAFMMSSVANAAIINLNSETGAVETLNLGPGNYLVEVIGTNEGGAFDAWNAWGRLRGCQSDNTCTNGFINSYVIESDAFGIMRLSNGGRYRTPQLALFNAVDSRFTLFDQQDVQFYISDSNFRDNNGGISLRVTYVSAPAALGVLGLSLMALPLVRRFRNSR